MPYCSFQIWGLYELIFLTAGQAVALLTPEVLSTKARICWEVPTHPGGMIKQFHVKINGQEYLTKENFFVVSNLAPSQRYTYEVATENFPFGSAKNGGVGSYERGSLMTAPARELYI